MYWAHWWALQKRLNQLRCHLGCTLVGAAQGTTYQMGGCTSAPPCEYYWMIHAWQWYGLMWYQFGHLFLWWKNYEYSEGTRKSEETDRPVLVQWLCKWCPQCRGSTPSPVSTCSDIPDYIQPKSHLQTYTHTDQLIYLDHYSGKVLQTFV